MRRRRRGRSDFDESKTILREKRFLLQIKRGKEEKYSLYTKFFYKICVMSVFSTKISFIIVPGLNSLLFLGTLKQDLMPAGNYAASESIGGGGVAVSSVRKQRGLVSILEVGRFLN